MSQNHDRLEALFNAALELASQERETYLSQSPPEATEFSPWQAKEATKHSREDRLCLRTLGLKFPISG